MEIDFIFMPLSIFVIQEEMASSYFFKEISWWFRIADIAAAATRYHHSPVIYHY